MTKRFPLELDKELHESFLRAYPSHGDRSNLLRKCIRRLVQRASLIQDAVDGIADDALDKFQWEKERIG